MSLVRSYFNEAPETVESVIEELFSNHSMFYVINNLYHHTNCVCIPGVGNSQLGCTKIWDSREILEIPKDSMRGEIGRFWPGRTRVYEDSGELPTPGVYQRNLLTVRLRSVACT
jgi:hypothetical protein